MEKNKAVKGEEDRGGVKAAILIRCTAKLSPRGAV